MEVGRESRKQMILCKAWRHTKLWHVQGGALAGRGVKEGLEVWV